MANSNNGIDAAFRHANREQDRALASLDRVNREKDRVSRQSTADVWTQVEDTAKTDGSWVEKKGY